MGSAQFLDIRGDHIDNSYETSCTIEKAWRAGADLKIGARCDSEDINYSEAFIWRLLNDRSFQFRGRTYTLCPAILDQLRCVEPPNPAPALQYGDAFDVSYAFQSRNSCQKIVSAMRAPHGFHNSAMLCPPINQGPKNV